MTPPNEKSKNWQKFEIKVEQILKLAGYEVDRDVLVAGGQTDLIAIKQVGPMITRLLVECKYSESSKSVGIDAVENFSGRVLTLRSDDLIDAGMLVTNASFTRFAKAFPQKSYIILKTIEQLYSMIFDFRPYLMSLIDDFDRSRLNITFVKPLMDAFNYDNGSFSVNDYIDDRKESDEVPIDMVDFCDKWLTDKESNRLCLLGDYGTGKTSFCSWYAAHQARKFLNKPEDEPIPLLIPLHRFTKSVDIDTLVTDFLVNQCQIGNFRLSAFQFLLDQGKFLVLLDGFDEMARHVDREVRYQTITELSRLAHGEAKIILTGRPSYFPTDEELVEALGGSEQSELYAAARNAYNELVDYNFYKVRLFSIKQIREFVLKSIEDQKHAEKVLNYIESRYDLYDLASRPVLLEMIVKSLPRLLESEPQATVNAAKLYDIYTGLWLDREYKKGEFRKLINKDDKLRFMEELSFQLFTEDRYSLSHRKIGDPIRKFFNITDSELDYFSHDIRTCSFLQRIPIQGYTFAHRSFQEFFVAKKILRAVKMRNPAPWGSRHFPAEIVRFTSELIVEENDQIKNQLITWSAQNSEEIQSKNCLSVALLAGCEIIPSIVDHYQMKENVLRGYASFRIGDNLGSTKFLEYLYSIILESIDRVTIELSHIKADQSDVLGDVFFQANKLIQQQPIKTAKELYIYLEDIVKKSWLGLARERIETLKEEIGFDSLFKEYRSPIFDQYIDLDSIPQYKNIVDTIESIESSQIIKICMGLLNDNEKNIIQYYYFDENTYQEIADKMGRHPNTIRSMLHRIHIRLRRALSLKDIMY